MTSRRSRPRRSSGSRSGAGAGALAALLAVFSLALTGGAARAESGALVERHDGVEIDWAEGTVTVVGGAAADLRMPSADVARAGAVRRAEAAARARLADALAVVPLGGGRKPASEDVQRAVRRARLSQSDYQSNGGAVVRVTARFVDWLESPPAAPTLVLAVASAHLAAAPAVKVGGREVNVGAASYRVGAPPRDAKAVTAKVERGGRVVVEGQKGGDLAERLARGTALIYVEKVLK
jgi:hypothetical protein